MNTPRHNDRRAGQAMIELMLGMIMLLILLIGAVQFLEVADAHTGIDSVIRGRTGFIAMSPRLLEDSPRYIQNWDPGTDNQRFTADDHATCIPATTIQTIANGSAAGTAGWDAFSRLSQPSSLAALRGDPVPLMALGFIGLRLNSTVPVSEFAQELFYDHAEVLVQEDCWIPILNGLY
jgi:hypothetical protein